jgi:hypothetical protein
LKEKRWLLRLFNQRHKMAENENILKKYLEMEQKETKGKTVHCPNEEALLNYLEKKISGQVKLSLEKHISGCSFCLSQLSLAYEAQKIKNKALPHLPKGLIEKVKNFVQIDKNTQVALLAKKKKIKKNLFLVATVIFFALSFIIHRYFMQFLFAALILGLRWAFESDNARTLIMVFDAWRKHSHDDDSEISQRLKDKFSKHDL